MRASRRAQRQGLPHGTACRILRCHVRHWCRTGGQGRRWRRPGHPEHAMIHDREEEVSPSLGGGARAAPHKAPLGAQPEDITLSSTSVHSPIHGDSRGSRTPWVHAGGQAGTRDEWSIPAASVHGGHRDRRRSRHSDRRSRREQRWHPGVCALATIQVQHRDGDGEDGGVRLPGAALHRAA